MLTGAVAVETEVNRINRTQEFLHMLDGHSRTECRTRFGKTRLRKLDHVHVALADNGAMLFADAG